MQHYFKDAFNDTVAWLAALTTTLLTWLGIVKLPVHAEPNQVLYIVMSLIYAFLIGAATHLGKLAIEKVVELIKNRKNKKQQ